MAFLSPNRIATIRAVLSERRGVRVSCSPPEEDPAFRRGPSHGLVNELFSGAARTTMPATDASGSMNGGRRADTLATLTNGLPGASGPRGKGCAAVILLLAVLGCAPPRADWTKPGATSADLRRDLAYCEGKATGPTPFHFWALNMDYETARDHISRVRGECMEAHGWQHVTR